MTLKPELILSVIEPVWDGKKTIIYANYLVLTVSTTNKSDKL